MAGVTGQWIRCLIVVGADNIDNAGMHYLSEGAVTSSCMSCWKRLSGNPTSFTLQTGKRKIGQKQRETFANKPIDAYGHACKHKMMDQS